jgi:hypothetical protein
MFKDVFRWGMLSIIPILLPFTAVFGQMSIWDFGGYAKNLITYADGEIEWLPIEVGRWQNTTQLRLNLFMYPEDNIATTIQARTLLIYQENSDLLRQFQAELNTVGSYFFDLKYDWLEEEDIFGFSEIDRLYFDWIFKDWEVIFGRQRIAWGTCLVWNPTDLFNPYDILDFDYEERPGADALQVQYYTGPLSQFNIAATPGRTSYEVIYAARYMTNNWNYDFNFIAGWQLNSLRLATSWAGEFYDGGFRGEVLYTDPNIESTIISIDLNSITYYYQTEEVKDPYWTFVLSYDYTFKNSFYIHTEYIYNGLGTTENAGSRRFDILYTGELTPARQSIFQQFSYQITPLLRGDFFVIFNPNDKSWIAAPSLQYSIATNWSLYLLAFPSEGDPGTEYSGFPDQYFARVEFSF